MTDEQVENLVERMARPIFILRMAKGDKRPGAEKRRSNARDEIRKVIIDVIGPDLKDQG